ncbi:MAG TPA: hypothetical protein VH080_03570 [Gemmatimonadaceae bacterium]|jgi:hypothetical protein|nr:hypothetical protein [Gemmatimonadaceae bacterium]
MSIELRQATNHTDQAINVAGAEMTSGDPEKAFTLAVLAVAFAIREASIRAKERT